MNRLNHPYACVVCQSVHEQAYVLSFAREKNKIIAQYMVDNKDFPYMLYLSGDIVGWNNDLSRIGDKLSFAEFLKDTTEEVEPDTIHKSHIDYLNDIYGAVNGRDMLEIFEITQKIPDPAEFGRIAKELHSQAVKPYIPGPLKLCQNVFAEINNPTPTKDDGEWTEPF